MKPKTITLKAIKRYAFLIVILFVVPMVMASDCSTDSDPEEGSVPFEILGEVTGISPTGDEQNIFDCYLNTSSINRDSLQNGEDLSRLEFVLTTQKELDKYVICQDVDEVDFEREFVLAGMSAYQPTYPSIKEQNVRFSNDSLYYEIELQMGSREETRAAIYIVKILSREYLGYPVVFNIYWEEEL